MRRVAAVVAVLCAVLTACGREDAANSDRTQRRTLVVNDAPTDVCVAVASTLAEQVTGLSKRPSIPSKEGMAFLFGTAGDRSFTMKDTNFPLAIVWVGPEGKVLSSDVMNPHDAAPKFSPGPIILAIELSPSDWSPHAATARTVSLGDACQGTITAGPPGVKPSTF